MIYIFNAAIRKQNQRTHSFNTTYKYDNILDSNGKFNIHSFFISTWPIKHMKAYFFEKIKHIAHEGSCRKK